MTHRKLTEILEKAEDWAWQNHPRLSPRGKLHRVSSAVIAKSLTVRQAETIIDKLKVMV